MAEPPSGTRIYRGYWPAPAIGGAILLVIGAGALWIWAAMEAPRAEDAAFLVILAPIAGAMAALFFVIAWWMSRMSLEIGPGGIRARPAMRRALRWDEIRGAEIDETRIGARRSVKLRLRVADSANILARPGTEPGIGEIALNPYPVTAAEIEAEVQRHMEGAAHLG